MRHLQEKNGNYYARLVVPEELRPYIGKRELSKALSPDRMEARRLLPGVVGRFHDQLNAARDEMNAERQPRASAPPEGTILSRRNLAKVHYETELEKDDTERLALNMSVVSPQQVDFQQQVMRPTYEGLLREVAAGRSPDDQTAAVIGWAIDGFRQRGNTKVEYGTDDWRTLAISLAGIQLEVFQRSRERNEGVFTGQPTHPLLVTTPTPDDPLKARLISPDSDKPLSELVGQFLAERKPGPQAQHEHRRTVAIFEEHLGEPLPVYRITRQHIHSFKRALSEAPASATKYFPGKTFPEAIAANKQRKVPYPALNVKTINDGHLSKLSAFLNWCKKSDILPDNPASGIKIEAAKETAPPKIPFSPDDLTRLFGEHFREKDGSLRERQWAMLISLFSGTRPSELAQMKLNSVRTERGVLVFAVEEETKNIGSQRLVPVHSKLTELGLNEYVAKMRKARQTHLFPDWYRDGMKAKEEAATSGKTVTLNHYFPRYIPRRFNTTYLPKVGIFEDRKTWYSFRHTFKTGLARAGVAKDLRDELCGHADNSAGAIYVHDSSIEARRDAIEKLSFDGFPL